MFTLLCDYRLSSYVYITLWLQAMNLGQVNTMTWGTSGNTVTLKYSNGDVCSTDTSKRHETTIYFGCAASGQVREK